MEGIAGLGELGLPELGRMAGGMPDPSFVNLLLQNPAIMQMMQSLLSNPQFMNQVLNPQLRSLSGSNSQLSSMLQNPELIRHLTSETLQQLLSFQLVFSNNQTRVINTSGLEFLMNRFSELGSGAGVPNNPDVPLEDRYATQLSQLQEMFFFGH